MTRVHLLIAPAVRRAHMLTAPADVAGRKHQLRRHMAAIGFPIVGDTKYTHGAAQWNGSEETRSANAGSACVTQGVDAAADTGGSSASDMQEVCASQRNGCGASAASWQAVQEATVPCQSERRRCSVGNVGGSLSAPDSGDLVPSVDAFGERLKHSKPRLALWAVELRFQHPVSGEAMCVMVPRQEEMALHCTELMC